MMQIHPTSETESMPKTGPRVQERTVRKPRDADNRDEPEARSASLTEQIYQALWRDIVFGDLAPGSSLDELLLVERFKSSRTPIREALARLAGDNLVVQHRNRGTYVSEIKVSELSAFFEALHLLQRVITRLAAQRWTDDDLNEIRRCAQVYADHAGDSDFRGTLERDQAIHLRIAGASRNPHLQGLYQRLLAMQMRLLLLHAQSYGGQDLELADQSRNSVMEHKDLIDALTMRDADTAERLAGEHTRIIRKRVAGFTSGELNTTVN
jgi:DNA-binding GntR family transcriptional regulator